MDSLARGWSDRTFADCFGIDWRMRIQLRQEQRTNASAGGHGHG
jgi:hypothetical protein